MNNIEENNENDKIETNGETNFKNILKKKNYIATKNLMEKIKKITDYMSKGIPVLLEVPNSYF